MQSKTVYLVNWRNIIFGEKLCTDFMPLLTDNKKKSSSDTSGYDQSV